MALEFVGASNQYGRIADPIITAYPLTMACWFNVANNTDAHTLMMITDEAASTDGFTLAANGSIGGDPVRVAAIAAGSFGPVDSTAGWSINTWHHACGVFAGAMDRRAFLDGGNKGTSAVSRSPSGMTAFNLGRFRSNVSSHTTGMIAVPCIWNIALDDADVAELAAGKHPSLVRPANIVALWELDNASSPVRDSWGVYPLTLTNTPTLAVDPPLIYPVEAI